LLKVCWKYRDGLWDACDPEFDTKKQQRRCSLAKAKELGYKAKMFTRKTFMSLRMGVMPEG